MQKQLSQELKKQFLEKTNKIKSAMAKKDKSFLIEELESFISSFLILNEVHFIIYLTSIYNWVFYEEYEQALKEFDRLTKKIQKL